MQTIERKTTPPKTTPTNPKGKQTSHPGSAQSSLHNQNNHPTPPQTRMQKTRGSQKLGVDYQARC
jgi:hypothetical protein